MKKSGLLLIVLMILTACSGFDQKLDKESLMLYETYWKSLLNETQFQKNSRNFDISAEIVHGESGYDYYVTVDNPKIAMYDVEIVVVEDGKRFDSVEEMLPSAGIFEKKFNMVPNQTRTEKGFMEGAALARYDFEEPEVTLQILVSWKNYTKLDTFKEVFELELKYEDETEKDSEEDVTEEEIIEEEENES